MLDASLKSHCSCTTKYFWKNSYTVEVRSPYLYASFGTFCAQIGQLFEAPIWTQKVPNMSYKFSCKNFQKYFVAHELLAVKYSFSTYAYVLKGFILVASTVLFFLATKLIDYCMHFLFRRVFTPKIDAQLSKSIPTEYI